MDTVTTDTARRNLAHLLEQVYYHGTHIQIRRNKRPMAWLVGAPFLMQIHKLVDLLKDSDPALADTVELLLDADVMDAIRIGQEDIAAGRVRSLTDVLQETHAL